MIIRCMECKTLIKYIEPFNEPGIVYDVCEECEDKVSKPLEAHADMWLDIGGESGGA